MPGMSATRGPHVFVTSAKTKGWEGIALIYCGIDWAERTHDVALVDETAR